MNKNKDRYGWLKGVIAPLVTPITKEEKLDINGLEKLVGNQLKNKVNVLFILGSVGEGPRLTSKVRKQVVKETIRICADKIPVIAGVMDNSVSLVLEKIKELEDFGICAGLVTLPYYGWQKNINAEINFFLTLADKSPVPVVAYNLPSVVGSEIDFKVIERLFKHTNIAGIKNSGSNPDAMKRIIKAPNRPEQFKFLLGNSAYAKEMLFAGADGLVATVSNLFPELILDIYDSAKLKKIERVKFLQKSILELNKVGRYPSSAGGIKCALNILGICNKYTVRPWPEANRQDEIKIRQILNKVKKMYSKLSERAE